MRRHWIEIPFHVAFWVISAWLIATSFSIESNEIEIVNGIETVKIIRNGRIITHLLLVIGISIMVFYANTQIVLRHYEHKKKTFFYALILIGLTALSILLASKIPAFKSSPRLPLQIYLGIALFYFTISLVYALILISLKNEQRQQRLLLDKKQTELTLLRNQLQPHFLFNALNNLMIMVNQTENTKLTNSFDTLSHLLRYVVDETQGGKVLVSKEIAFLQSYTELQELRFDDNEIQVHFMILGCFDEQRVEPGLFIPFVENAFKYGTEPEKVSTIDIEFDLSKPNEVIFNIKNKVRMVNTNSKGTGIETTRRRLDLIYPNRHKLKITEMGDFIVELNINTE